jgi:hypothetical protein
MKEASEVLLAALVKLDKTEHFEKYSSYLKSEWYTTVQELKLAIDDERFSTFQSWL